MQIKMSHMLFNLEMQTYILWAVTFIKDVLLFKLVRITAGVQTKPCLFISNITVTNNSSYYFYFYYYLIHFFIQSNTAFEALYLICLWIPSIWTYDLALLIDLQECMTMVNTVLLYYYIKNSILAEA